MGDLENWTSKTHIWVDYLFYSFNVSPHMFSRTIYQRGVLPQKPFHYTVPGMNAHIGMINRKHIQWRTMNNYKFLLPHELNKGGEVEKHGFYSIANIIMLAFMALWREKNHKRILRRHLHVFLCIWNWWCALYGFNSTSTNGMEYK